jgi:hypothetical protein
MLQERPHFYDRHITVNKILNRNRFGEGNDTNQGRRVFLVLNLVNFSMFEGILSCKKCKYAAYLEL